MGDAILISVWVVVVLLSVLLLLHIKSNRDACHALGGVYLESQCVKGEIIE